EVELTVAHDVEAVAVIACADDEVAGGHRHWNKAGRDAFFHRDRKRCEHWHTTDELQLGTPRHCLIYLNETPVGDECEEWQNRPDENECRTRSDRTDDGRS